MIIRIRSSVQVFALTFENDEEFKKIHHQIVEALTDSNNTKGVNYEKDGIVRMFPALLLKNSIIEIDKDSETDVSVIVF